VSLPSDLSYVQLKYEQELVSTPTTADRRKFQRLMAVEAGNSGFTCGAGASLQQLGYTPLAMNDTTFATDLAAVVAAVAQLVTDAGSPTQAHVNAANSAYTTLKADLPPRTYVAADKVTFEAALAVLVADAASPTQAHVNTANTAWGAFLGGLV
jgi:hypothetical protein